MMSFRKPLRALLFGAILFAAAGTAHAQNPTGQSNMVFTMYAQAATQWMQVAHGYAQTLFGLLAVIDFAWTAVMLALEGHELNTYMARIIRKLMTISFFAVVLAQGTYWMGAISASFIKVGQAAGGTNAVTPAQILGDGFTMAAALLGWASTSATTIGLTTFAPAVPVLFALIVSLFLLAGYGIVAINFVVTTIEGFVVIGAGYIFLGFGGSQWTRPYVERYIALAVSLGARMMILYMIVGLGHSFATQWVTILQGMSTLDVVADPSNAFMTMCGILCGAITYTGVAIMAPRLVGSIMSGSLSFSGNEALSMGSGAALGAAAVLAAIPTGGGSMAAAGAAGAGTLAAGGAGASAAGLAAGSSAAASTTAMGLGTAVAPPAAAAAGGGPASIAGQAGGAGASTVSGGGLNVPPPPVAASSGTSTASAGSVAPPPVGSSGGSSNGASASNSTPSNGSSPSSASPPPAAVSSSNGNGASSSAASNGGSSTGVGSLGAPSSSNGSAPSGGSSTGAPTASASSGGPTAASSTASPTGSGTPQTGGASGTSQTTGNAPPPPAAGAASPPPTPATAAAGTQPNQSGTGPTLGQAAQQAKGGIERIIGATEIGSSEAPPPHAHIEGGE